MAKNKFTKYEITSAAALMGSLSNHKITEKQRRARKENAKKAREALAKKTAEKKLDKSFTRV